MNTSVDNSPANEWELSKENVQPLKSGRKVASLTAALQPLSTDQSKIREQKQIFEAEVRTYSGNDPLDVWHRYIEWTEQNFPKGGKTSHLSIILERCVSLFKHDVRYKNDQRYLDAWIKFSKICNDPLEIYNFIYNLGIGDKLAAFYKAWAWELEQTGNTKKADAIYIQGIQNGAEPLDQLCREHSEFQARVAQKLMAEPMEDESDSPSRAALGELRTTGSKHKVPVNRVDAVKPSGRGLKTALAPIKSNTGPGFQVFNDENGGSTFALPKPSGEWKQMGSRSQVNRENEQKPGIWSNVKVKQRNTVVVPVSAVSSHSAPKFEVHADDDVDHALVTPRKVTPVDQVLSAKKDKFVDPFQNIQQQPQNKKEIVMYCKDLIYGGAEEFSFEELRAARLQAKKKREQNRLEQLQREHELLLQKQREEMQMEREKLQQQLQLQQQQQELLEQQRRQMQQAQEQLEKERQQQLQKNQIMEQQLQQQMLAKMRAMEQAQAECVEKQNAGPANRCLGFNTSVTKQASNVSLNNSLRQPGSRNTSYHTPNLSFNTTSSGGSARVGSLGPTPDSSGFIPYLSSGSGSKNSSARTSLVAPSPTVNTKEALQVVMGMFNQTLEIDQDYGWGHRSSAVSQEHLMEDEYAAKGPVSNNVPSLFGSAPTAIGSAPFEIFQENPEPAPSAKKKDADCEDKENVPCVGYQNGPKRAALSGILQPSTDIYSVPLEEQEAQQKEEEEAMEQCDVQPQPRQEEEFMDGIQEFMMPLAGEDMTFAPAFSSTRNFTDMARLASTPFNPSEQPGSLPAPPVSTIKAGDQMPEVSIHADHTVLSEAEDLKNGSSMARGLFGEPSRVPGPPPAESFEATEIQAEKSIKKLSPILEGSDELIHNNTTGSTMCGTSHCTTLSSSIHGPGAHTNSSHHHPTKPLPSVKEIPHDSFVKPESVAKPIEDNPADQTYHEIDVTNYLPADFDVKSSPLCTSILIDPYDPFDQELIDKFLSELPTPISSYPHYHKFHQKMPKMQPGSIISLGNESYQVEKCLGEGGFAKIYQACSLSINMDDDLDCGDEKRVLKVQQPGCPWEFYITTELHHRLEELQSPVNVRPSIMSIDHGYFYNDGSCLVNQFHINGTVLDLVNLHKKKRMKMREPLVIYLAIEMLHIVHQMQKCNIIHGDIKPDNFLIKDIPTSMDITQRPLLTETKVLKLIDFGRSIDMKMFPHGTTFMAKVNTSGFECIEMKTDRPWTFQTDLFGVVGTIHVMMFNQYMKVYQEGGRWKTTSNFKRSFKASNLWKDLFDDLLNIQSCQELPDLAGHIAKFEQYLQQAQMPMLFAEAIKTLSIQLFEEH